MAEAVVRFVDTSFLIALQVVRDAHHDEALTLWRDESERLATTNHVVGETWTGLRRRAGHRAAAAFYAAAVNDQRLTIVSVNDQLGRVAWRVHA